MTKGAWAYWPLIPRLFPYLKPYKSLVVVSLLLSALAVVLGVLEPWPLAFMVDTVLGNHPVPDVVRHVIGSRDRTTLLVIAALSGLVLVASRNLMTVVHEYVNTRLHQWVVLDFRSDLFQHAERLSVSYHDSKPTGQLMSQMNWLPDYAGGLLLGIPPLVQSLVTLVAMFVIAINIDPILALLALTVVPVMYYSVGIYAAGLWRRTGPP